MDSVARATFKACWGTTALLPQRARRVPSDCRHPRYTIPITQPSCLIVDDEGVIRSSIGASILWASPLGQIRFDFAVPVTKGKYDQTQFFNFSGGTPF